MPVSSASSQFPHRTNQNGVIDSICPHCFVTIGSSNCEADLEKIELAHVCDPALVRYYEGQTDSMEKRPARRDAPRRLHRNIA